MSTTVLPPLSSAGGYLTQKVLESIPRDKTYDTWHNKPAKKHPNGASSGRQRSPSTMSAAQSNEIKDTAKYRNSFFHNLCLEMLKDGFHCAFRELFNLTKSESDDDPENLDTTPSVIDSPEKLNFIKDQLITAELAERQGKSEKIYEAQLALSKFFEQDKNYKLANYFYSASFDTSRQIRGDGRRREAEANFNLGTAAEHEKDYLRAQKLYEEYYTLTDSRAWKSDDGSLLHNHARDCLTRVLITLSNQISPDDESKVLEYLHKAYDLIKGCSDIDSRNNVGYLLGCKYDSYGNHEKAVEYLTEYLVLCQSKKDDVGTGKAYQALAYAHQRQGNMEDAAENLKLFLSVMENSGDLDTLRDACTDLGALYNYIGRYEQSSKYYKRAFEMAQDKKKFDDIESSRCEYGLALAHGLFSGEVESITHTNKNNIEMLLHWKCERAQGFTNDNQTYSMYPPLMTPITEQNGAEISKETSVVKKSVSDDS